MAINWPVTSKPYSVCGKNEKTRSSRKSDFRNKLQLMSPLKPTSIPPTDVKVCVVDAMRVLRLIPITTTAPPTFLKWAEAVKIFSENLLGLRVVPDDYSPGDENIFRKKLSRKYNNVKYLT